MSKQHRLNAQFSNKDANVRVQVILISFKEDNYFIVYSPHLDVSGYGVTEEEAMDSFNNSLKQFLDYTTNKKTLHKELTNLGWELKKGTPKKPKKINAPSFDDLINNNDSLKELINKHDIVTHRKEVAIPV